MKINEKAPIIVQLKKSKIEIVSGVIKIIVRTVFWIFLFVIIVNIFNQESHIKTSFKTSYVDWYGAVVSPDSNEPNIAIIPIYGMIANKQMNVLDGTNSETILRILENVRKDESIKAVVLKIDSPGGTVLDSEKIAKKIQEVKKNKKVYALMESVAASGGYFIASQADKIFAYKETLTGSIGVIMELPNFKKMTDKIGVDVISITSGNMKAMGSPFNDFTEEERVVFQELVNETYQRFVDYVVEGRGLSEEAVKELADGRIFSGAQAFKHNLIDSADGLDGLKKELASNNLKNANLIEFFVTKSPFEELMRPVTKVFSSILPQEKAGPVLYYKY